jgi:hypothetical protein
MAGQLPHTPKGQHPQYFQDPATDRLLSMVLSLIGELAVTRDRVDTLERLLEKHGVFPQAEVHAYRAEGEVKAERDARRAEYLDRVMRVLQNDIDEMRLQDNPVSVEETFEIVRDE